MRLSEDAFRELVSEALDELPDSFREMLNNVEVTVENLPPSHLQKRARGLILGLYQGVPLNRRSHMMMPLPDKISIYQRNIERVCSTPNEVKNQVKKTVLHEIGHHFGMSEKQLREAGY